ncbi:molybdopterin cofactor-binding domain-containing protein [Reichenbachiella sp.]|uniref:xanthine dehydrogenase family protein molybdopterin-binding subunit n=1 Tax=Reichenbachiella sp. TaxID=2184521 RepID=UPI003BB16F3B
MSDTTEISRRKFLASLGLASGGLILACNPLTESFGLFANEPLRMADATHFVQLLSDGSVKIVAARSEMGQGVRTSLTAAIADEMDADWDQVSVVQATGDERYGNQNTDGSRSIRTTLVPIRQMGGMARLMLIGAAAAQWQVDPSECKTENHHVVHTSGKKIYYGDLVDDLKNQPLPEKSAVKLKEPKDFKYIGKGLKSVDIEGFVSGQATYGIDVRLEGMKYAAIARCPVAHGTINSFDDTEALKVNGVERVLALPRISKPFGNQSGVAVVANGNWPAKKGKAALKINWDYGDNVGYNTEQYLGQLKQSVNKPLKKNNGKGNVNQAFSTADQLLERDFVTPHLVHAPMETPNAVAWVKGDGTCEVWAPTQTPQVARKEVAAFLDIDLAKVTINVTLLGGGFGRKAKPDYIIEAVALSKSEGAPVQVLWSREDDIQNSYFHACSAQKLKASLDAKGAVTGWLHRTSFPPIGSTFKPGSTYGANWEIGQGTAVWNEIPNYQIENGEAPAHLRIGWMRSVCNIHHSFAANAFMDELAELRGVDPVLHRLELLSQDRVVPSKAPHKFDSARMKAVIKEVAALSDWGVPLPEGEAYGLAAEYSFFTYVASVAHVVVKNGEVRVKKIYTAADCGLVVNPDTVKAQLEGSAIFGTSIALKSKITVKDGQVEQNNFNDYQVARMSEAPEVRVKLIKSDEAPSGIGEPGVPVIAPAIFNGVAKALGKRFYTLPLSDHSVD